MKGKAFLGIIFILVGIGALLEQLGLGDFGYIISTWWPLILIIAGVFQLTSRSVSKVSGIILLFIGVFFQLKELNVITVSIMNIFWPLLIIVIGVSILLPRKNVLDDSGASQSNDEVVNEIAFFSGVRSVNTSSNFRGGSLVAIFGGASLDLTNAVLSNQGTRIDATVAFGGIDVYVPENCKVIIKGIPIFGGWSNKTNQKNINNGLGPVIEINCFAAFGGIDVKNRYYG